MKVAVCITGLPRCVKEGYDLFYKQIINDYNADVYLHYWNDNKYGDTEYILQTYNPKKYIAETPFSFKEYTSGVKIPYGLDSSTRPMQPYDIYGCFTSLPMFYSWQSGINLIDENYDCIIRGRFDIGRESTLNLDLINLNYINVSNGWPNHTNIDDNLCILNNTYAKSLYSDIFEVFTHYIKTTKEIYYPEYNLKNVLIEKGLYDKVVKTPYLDFKLLRENKVWYSQKEFDNKEWIIVN